jgi:L-asparaginase
VATSGNPRVAVFTLGGTIAMQAAPGGGAVPRLSAAELLAAIPGLSSVSAGLTVTDVANKPSASLSFADLYGLAALITAELDGGCAGVVVVQGTDTIEETSYLLDLLIPGDAPVVLTGAMRNPSLAGPDGPANLLAAIRVAGSRQARGLGALVVMNDQIHAARWVTKTHSSSPAAFASPGFGPLGHLAEGRVSIPLRLAGRMPALRPALDRQVRVCLVTVTLGDDGALIEAAARHADGLVIAALGVGHVPADAVAAIAEAAAEMPVVLASRTGAGTVHQHTYSSPGSETDLLARGLISAGYLAPVKARLLLHLLVGAGAGIAEIRNTFASLPA